MSFAIWFPLGMIAGITALVAAVANDFMGLRSMLEEDIRSGMDEVDVWDVFQSHRAGESRDSYRLEEMLQRTQLWLALMCVLLGLVVLVGPW